jgi:hypothetical protein
METFIWSVADLLRGDHKQSEYGKGLLFPKPERVIGCPYCKGPSRIPNRNEFFFGVDDDVWTDGKVDTIYGTKDFYLLHCNYCPRVHRFKDAINLGSGSKGESSPAVFSITEPKEKEFYLAICRQLPASYKEQLHFQVLAWWRRNDPFRRWIREDRSFAGAEISIPPEGISRENMKDLTDKLDVRVEEDALLKAELYRELGDFAKAVAILDVMKKVDNFLVKRRDRIQSLCDLSEQVVQIV